MQGVQENITRSLYFHMFSHRLSNRDKRKSCPNRRYCTSVRLNVYTAVLYYNSRQKMFLTLESDNNFWIPCIFIIVIFWVKCTIQRLWLSYYPNCLAFYNEWSPPTPPPHPRLQWTLGPFQRFVYVKCVYLHDVFVYF